MPFFGSFSARDGVGFSTSSLGGEDRRLSGRSTRGTNTRALGGAAPLGSKRGSNGGHTVRRAARIALGVTIVLGGVVVLPRPASRVIAPDARAQIVPTLPDIIRRDPSPSPSNRPRPRPLPGTGGGGGGRNPAPILRPAPKRPKPVTSANKALRRAKKRSRQQQRSQALSQIIMGYSPVPGGYNTDKLVAAAARLRSLGMPPGRAMRMVYPPFIIAGQASWSDSWGAPRFGPGPIVRRHQGQDVFCHFGAPVLASEDGVVEFGEGGLGGKVARLHRPDGTYWYYAHLSDWNTKQVRSGQAVKMGDVIGFCGNSGNAVGGSPHVHFGWYGGAAMNPYRTLIRWLRQAERRAARAIAMAANRRVFDIGRITLARRFGDAFLPDRSKLTISMESLWASGKSAGGATFPLAQMALRAALSNRSLLAPQLAPGAQVRPVLYELLSPSSILARLSSAGKAVEGEGAGV